MVGDHFSIVREDLHRRYATACDPAEIDAALDAAIAAHATDAVRTFVSVIVEREAAERLEQLAGGKRLAPRREILFVDERNTGRAQIATALLRHHNRDAIASRSVGLNPVAEGIDKRVLDILHQRGIDTEGLSQEQFTARTVHRSNVVVLLGVDGLPDLPGDRYETWDIADPQGASHEEVAAIVDDIDVRVRGLIDTLS